LQNEVDGLSRRRERIQLEDGILVTKRYVYDGWLVVAVHDGDNEVLEQYVHGVDLSGTREGAGGIGGVLQAVGDEVAYYHYDGNGNVISATDSNAVVMTRLEYDPFGRVLVADGSYTPRYQFSSKEYDTATGLNYYGFRYYSPQLGRWVSRDPIGERGGRNVYLFCLNRPISVYDKLGLLPSLERVLLAEYDYEKRCINTECWLAWRAGVGRIPGQKAYEYCDWWLEEVGHKYDHGDRLCPISDGSVTRPDEWSGGTWEGWAVCYDYKTNITEYKYKIDWKKCCSLKK